MRPSLRTHLAAAGAAVLLAACGGGGGSPGATGGGTGGGVVTPPATTTFNFDAAMERLFTTSTTLSASTSDSSNASLTAVYATVPQPDASFENSSRKRVQETLRLARDGVTQSSDTSTTFFGISPFTVYGSLDSDGGYTVATTTGTLPSAGTIGQSGPLYNDVSYADSTKGRVTGRSQTRWSLETGSGSNAFACLNITLTNENGQSDGAVAQCFLISNTGVVSGMRLTLTTPAGQSVVFR